MLAPALYEKSPLGNWFFPFTNKIMVAVPPKNSNNVIATVDVRDESASCEHDCKPEKFLHMTSCLTGKETVPYQQLQVALRKRKARSSQPSKLLADAKLEYRRKSKPIATKRESLGQ
ncbi:MAG: hypothetical protein JRN52_02100 [Nitrososphaerota archaeon]|nr:hypothetical protein [Nitrososphaerota archaeon]